MATQFMSELICNVCAYTGHVAWDSTGPNRRPLDTSTHIKLDPERSDQFTCLKCGTFQSCSA